MKKILLLGDSITIGYEKFVKQSFEGVADVYFPKVNCAFAQYMLRFLNIWKDEENIPDDVDLVHFNAGLWDVLRIYDDDTLTPPEFYGQLLVRIVKRIKTLFSKAKIVFALSTNVVEEGYFNPPYSRFNADVERFNSIAIDVLSPLSVTFNDLYTLTKDFPADSSCRSDMTHFNTDDGVKLVGGQVVETICKELGVPMEKVCKIEAKAQVISSKILRN